MIHTIDPALVRRRVKVLVVGCGGSGSAILAGLPYLHQAMLVSGHPGGLEVTAMDGDIVSPTNCVRQPFSQSEVGLFKSVVLVNRLNLFWNLDWHAVPEHLTAKSEMNYDLVIGCVDTRSARRLIKDKVTGRGSSAAYWLDLGNHSDGGQFVLGQPLNGHNRRSAARLRTVAEILPEIVNPALEDSTLPSCSALETIEKQAPFLNATLANHALALLARLFRHGQLASHGAFVSIAGPRVQPLPISAETWKRLRRRATTVLTPIKSERLRGARPRRGQRTME